jgi:hypothetical protein
MAKGDLGAAEFVGKTVEDRATKASAHRAGRASLGNGLLDDGIRVITHNMVVERMLDEPGAQGRRVMSGLPLIEVHGHKLEVDRRPAAQGLKDEQQGVAVFATRERDHDAIAGRDQSEIRDGSAHLVKKFALWIGLAGSSGG